jgi:hypothetical protein
MFASFWLTKHRRPMGGPPEAMDRQFREELPVRARIAQEAGTCAE